MSSPATGTNPTFFLNLPTASLPRAIAFYTALGFTPVPAWSDHSTATFLLPAPNQTISLMLHANDRFARFTRPGSSIADARTSTQALFSILWNDRESVDKWLEKAEGAGGKKDPYVMEGFGEEMGMYTRSWEDLDGHIWEGFCMLAKDSELQAGQAGQAGKA